jgi:hypothetical protein
VGVVVLSFRADITLSMDPFVRVLVLLAVTAIALDTEVFLTGAEVFEWLMLMTEAEWIVVFMETVIFGLVVDIMFVMVVFIFVLMLLVRAPCLPMVVIFVVGVEVFELLEVANGVAAIVTLFLGIVMFDVLIDMVLEVVLFAAALVLLVVVTEVSNMVAFLPKSEVFELFFVATRVK